MAYMKTTKFARQSGHKKIRSAKLRDALDFILFGAPYNFGKVQDILYSLVETLSHPLILPFVAAIFIATLLLLYFLGFKVAITTMLVISFSYIFTYLFWVSLSYSHHSYRNPAQSLTPNIKYKHSLILKFSKAEINLDVKDITKGVYKMPNYLSSMLQLSLRDMNRYFVLTRGSRENRPLLTLRGIALVAKNDSAQINLKLGMSSYYDMWYTHYFADVILSRRISRASESSKWVCKTFYPEGRDRSACEEFVTLRNTLSPYLRWHFMNSLSDLEPSSIEVLDETVRGYILKSSNKNKPKWEVCFPDLLPNGLGVTGIVMLKSADAEEPYTQSKQGIFILQTREQNIQDPGLLQWSFAGLIGALDDIFERRNYYRDAGEVPNGGTFFSVFDFLWEEILDEVLMPLELQDLLQKENAIEVRPIGIIINAEKLYQPELIVRVNINVPAADLDKAEKNMQSWETYLKHEKAKRTNLVLVPEFELLSENFAKWMREHKNRYRYIFPIVWALLKEDHEQQTSIT